MKTPDCQDSHREAVQVSFLCLNLKLKYFSFPSRTRSFSMSSLFFPQTQCFPAADGKKAREHRGDAALFLHPIKAAKSW